jgi:hypothetical protein
MAAHPELYFTKTIRLGKAQDRLSWLPIGLLADKLREMRRIQVLHGGERLYCLRRCCAHNPQKITLGRGM